MWLALAAEGHMHHTVARDWFAAQPDGSISFCRVTQMGLLRLLTNSGAMGQGPRTVSQSWDVYEQLRMDRRVSFISEPEGVEALWRKHMTYSGVGASSWTDAYLASFSQLHSSLLVTFDAGFRRWRGLNLLLLSGPPTKVGG